MSMPSGKAEKTPKADKGAEAPVADAKAAKDSTEKAPKPDKGSETEAKAAKEATEKAPKAADGETAAKATKEASQGKCIGGRNDNIHSHM